MELAALGSPRKRKLDARLGVAGPVFGVSYANLGRVARALGVDHDLARDLWASGNHDARVLATLIADPARLTARTLERWVQALDNHPVTDAFAKLAARAPAGRAAAARWLAADEEWVSAAGWGVLCWSLQETGAFTAADVRRHLRTIDRARRRVRGTRPV